MKGRLYYWRRWLRDFARYSPAVGRLTAAGLSLAARAAGSPLRRLALLTRAARLRPTPSYLASLRPRLEAELDRLEQGGVDWDALAGPARNDLPKALIVKPPVSPREKGLLYVTFEDHFLRLLRSGQAPAIAERYDLLLGPSCSPPPDTELLLMARLWPGRLFTLLSNFADAELMRAVSPWLVPVPLLASSWIDPDDFAPYLGRAKDYDIVLLAHFDPVKRHWLFFDALRRLPRGYRVLLMGVPLSGRTERHLRDEAELLGVAGRFDLQVRPSRDEVRAGLARGRVSLVLSQQEGACIAVAESLLAGTPVGLFRGARIGSKAFINEQTGVLLSRRNLADQLEAFVERSAQFSPRPWAVDHISCHASRQALDRFLAEAVRRDDGEWTRGVEPFVKDLVPAYLAGPDDSERAFWHEDFADRYGLLIGPAARRTATPHVVA